MYMSKVWGELENLIEKNDDLLLSWGREKIADWGELCISKRTDDKWKRNIKSIRQIQNLVPKKST